MELIDKIKEILEKELPQEAFKVVSPHKGFGGQYLKIAFAANDHQINGVRGQLPQVVSLNLDLADLELETQCFGGNGGRCIYRKPNLEDAKEKYLAMKSVKVPFRKPKKEEKSVLNAITKFCQNWLKTLKENKETLEYQNVVNYDELLK